MKKTWTDEEEDRLRDLLGRMRSDQAALVLGFSHSAVKKRMAALRLTGLPMRKLHQVVFTGDVRVICNGLGGYTPCKLYRVGSRFVVVFAGGEVADTTPVIVNMKTYDPFAGIVAHRLNDQRAGDVIFEIGDTRTLLAKRPKPEKKRKPAKSGKRSNK